MKRLRWIYGGSALCCALAAAVAAQAQIVIDGTADAGYGTALSIQNTQTQFGDNNRADLVDTEAGGSEIDQVFGKVENGRLHLMFAGNLENNFNKLEIFVDVDGSSGGVNEIVGSALPTTVDGHCCTIGGGVNLPDPSRGALQQDGVNGLIFDDGFFADYYLTISHGGENQEEPSTSDLTKHWAVSAHYADLTEGTSGRVVRAGMQLAPQGLPSVLRAPLASDYDRDFDVDGTDFLIWQRGFGTGTSNAEGDSDRDGDVDGDDLTQATLGWQDRYGDQPGLTDLPYNPTGPEINVYGTELTTQVLLDNSPNLPGLSQGQLIDKNYAMGAGGCTADTTDGGAGCIAPELDLVLPVDSTDPNNMLNHRNFDNTIDLQLALDNSNTAGVEGGSGTVSTGDPENVLTGIELSIPLDQLLDFLGNVPAGDIRVTAYVNATGHDFASNQWSGVGLEQGNPGVFGSLGFDLNFDAGVGTDQFVTIAQGAPAVAAVPEPASLTLLVGIGAWVGCRRRR